MSLKPSPLQPVPEETARVAQAAFPAGNPYLTFREALGPLLQDEALTALVPTCGHSGLAPWRLALVTVLQCRSNLAELPASWPLRSATVPFR